VQGLLEDTRSISSPPFVTSLLSKTGAGCGSAAPLCGRASPFRPEIVLFLSSSPRRRLSLRRGEDEVGRYHNIPGRRSQPAQQAAKPQIARRLSSPILDTSVVASRRAVSKSVKSFTVRLKSDGAIPMELLSKHPLIFEFRFSSFDYFSACLLRNIQKDPHRHEVHEQRRPSVAHEGQGNAFGGKKSQHYAHVNKRLSDDHDRQAECE